MSSALSPAPCHRHLVNQRSYRSSKRNHRRACHTDDSWPQHRSGSDCRRRNACNLSVRTASGSNSSDVGNRKSVAFGPNLLTRNRGQAPSILRFSISRGATFILISDRTNFQFAFFNLQFAMLMTPPLSLLITPAALNPIPMHRDSVSPRRDRTPSRPHVAPRRRPPR